MVTFFLFFLWILTKVNSTSVHSSEPFCTSLFKESDVRGTDYELIEEMLSECSVYHSRQLNECHRNTSFPALSSLRSEYINMMATRKLPTGGYGTVSYSRKRATALFTKLTLTLPPEGDIVETGCYLGSSASVVMDILIHYDGCHRKLWVFDSFEGLPDLVKEDKKDGGKGKYRTSYEVFKSNLQGLNVYDENRIVITKGWFNETLPISPVKHIAFLRLDGDLFSSTWDGLTSFHDKVLPGGIIYVDDYGSFRGCRDAIEKFRAENGITDPVHHLREVLAVREKIPKQITFEAIWWIKDSKKYYKKKGNGNMEMRKHSHERKSVDKKIHQSNQ
jgi:hypothetical protein